MRLPPSYGTMTERHLSAITEVEHPGGDEGGHQWVEVLALPYRWRARYDVKGHWREVISI